MYLNRKIYVLILVCTIISVFLVPVFADNETVSSGDQGATDLSGGQQVIVATTDTPTPDVTPDVTTIPTTEPTIADTTVAVTTQPTDIPTTDVTTTVPTAAPSVNESAVSSPVVDTPVMNETPEVPTSNITTISAPDTNLTLTSPDQTPGNITPDLVENTTLTLDLNATTTNPDTNVSAGNNYTWSDPPLNTSAANPYYLNTSGYAGWVINESGHDWVMDLNATNNTDTTSAGVKFSASNSTFYNFGTQFAILINASDVIFDGMGAILNGGGVTQYGIIVNKQSATNAAGNSLGPLGGISITNITLTGFTQTGILFNNVIGNQLGDIASNITDVNASYNAQMGGYGNGIVLQYSQNVEVSSCTIDNNGLAGSKGFPGTGDGLSLLFSSNNTITGNNVTMNHDDGFFVNDLSLSNNFTNNYVTGNGVGGFYLYGPEFNNINGNWITGNNGAGIVLLATLKNTIYNNFFNNTKNVDEEQPTVLDIWNITPTPGTNIVGGPNLGGNFWAQPDGKGWSQINPDTGGGFTKSYLLPLVTGNNEDQHPLVYVPTNDLLNSYQPQNLYYMYDGTTGNWVINQSGTYRYDLLPFNNSVNFDPTTNTYTNFGSSFGLLINASNVILDGMGAVLNGGGKTSYGIIVNNQNAAHANETSLGPLTGISISNITLTGFTQAGIFINNVIGTLPGAVTPSQITGVNANYNTASSASGIIIQNSADVEVSNSYASNNENSGITLWNSNNIILFNNAANRNEGNNGNGYGIYLNESNNATISGNNANFNYGFNNGYGIYLNESNNATISGNNAILNYGENGYGIYLTGSNNATISGNNVNKNAGNAGNGYGIYLDVSNYNNLTGNTADYNRGNDGNGYGIYLNESNYNNLSENTASGNVGLGGTGYGFYITGSNNNTFTGNTAPGNYNDGIMLSYASNNTLFNNTANGNKIGQGIHLYFSNSNNLTDNTATGNKNANGIFLEESNNNTLFNNTANSNNDGIYLRAAVYNNLTANTANWNDNGILLEASSNNSVSGNIANWNNDTGIYLLLHSFNNNLTGNTANWNNDTGIYLYAASITDKDNNNLINNTVNWNYNDGIRLLLSSYNNLTGNTANSNNGNGISLGGSFNNNLTGNTANSNNDTGIYLFTAVYNNLTSNWINGNNNYGFYLQSATDNTIYNNFFNNTNNTFVSSDSTGNIWNVTPTPGINIVGGPNLGGNYWAQPDGNGWSQIHPDIGNGFAESYNITAGPLSGQYQVCHGYGGVCNPVDFDYYPLVMPTPTPSPGPSGPSGSYNVVIQPLTPGTLPWDSTFTGNNIPGTMQSCGSYTVGLTVKNTGIMNWSSANGVVLISSSSNGFTFDPSRCRIPPGVVVQPGQSYTFPVIINVPCPMADGTYQLRFKMAYTVQTKSGPVEVPFGESLADSVTVGSSGVKMGVKSFAHTTTTVPGSPGRFTTSIPNIADNSPTTTITPGYYSGISRNILNGTVARNFIPATGFLWTIFVPDE